STRLWACTAPCILGTPCQLRSPKALPSDAVRGEGALMKKTPRINRQGLPCDAIGAAKSHYLLSDVVFIGGTLEQGPHSGLLLVDWLEVDSISSMGAAVRPQQ